MLIRFTAAGLVCVAATSLALAPAQAQDAARLGAIEAQIRTLQGELARMRRDLSVRDAEVRAARQDAARARADTRAETRAETRQASRPGPAGAGGVTTAAVQQPRGGGTPAGVQPGARQGGGASSVAPPSTSAGNAPANPGGVSFPQGRPTLTSSDGRYSAAVGLQLHYDMGGIFQGNRNPDTRAINRLNTFGQNLRRARIPFVFKYEDFQVNLTPDFGGSPDGSPTLFEANVNWNPVKPLVATIGYYKPQLTLQDSMSSNDFLFVERPSITEIARNIAAGDARAVVGARWGGERYFLAGYLTGGTYGSQTAALATPQQTGGVLRLAGRPVATADWDVHFGVSASEAFRIQRTAAGQTLNLQDRPEARIDQNRLIGTGALNATSAGEYGPEFGIRWRNFLLQGEYIRINVDRFATAAAPVAPGLNFSGGYVEGSWVITGEPRRYNAASGAFGNPHPERPFSLKTGGYGAFELVGRYSHTDLNSRVTRGVAATVTNGVYGGVQDIYAAGVNWYPDDQLRFMLDYGIINVDRLNAAGTTQVGQRVQSVTLRAQAAF